MKKILNKDNSIKEYKIGEHILIHRHIFDPESWHITIRPLNIFAKSLCKIGLNDEEVARYVFMILKRKQVSLNGLIDDVAPFIGGE